jgi:phosphotransferase system IIB component
MVGEARQRADLDELDGVLGVVVRAERQIRVVVGGEEGEDGGTRAL